MTLKIVFSLSILFLGFFIVACKSPKETDAAEQLTLEFELQKNPCYGKCPYYVMSIYKGGIVRFDGKKFVRKFGLYTKKLDKRTYKALKKSFAASNFTSFEDSYPSDIPDLPMTRVSYVKKGVNKSVVGNINRPDIVKDLEKQLEAIANDETGWTMRSVPNPPMQDFYIKEELIISLKQGTDFKEWIKGYDSWKMKIKKQISPKRNLWLVTYDRPDLNPAQVINLLSLDEEIIVLEFNKRVESKDQN